MLGDTGDAMERFLEVTTTTRQIVANETCEALENAGIPVVLEHVNVVDGGEHTTGYRLFVPSQHSQAAIQIVNGAVSRWQTEQVDALPAAHEIATPSNGLTSRP